MKEIETLFFELVRVAIGNQECMSRTPSQKEWRMLFDIAKKHSLVGICFVGLQRLGADADEGYARIGISKDVYFHWIGMAAVIQQKNKVVNRQCVELQARFSADGIRTSIFKGQGIATLYGEHICELRQSGDIDLYVDCGRKKAFEYLQDHGMSILDWDFVHTRTKFFEDTEVELHYRVSVTRNLWKNYQLQKFFNSNKDEFFRGTVKLPTGNIFVPSNWMNLFYLIQHAYRHLFTEGIGLRQVMDIYYAMKILILSKEDEERLKKATSYFGLDRFTSGMMWLLQHVFGMGMVGVPWVPNRHEGEFLLSEIMQSGNFGAQDDRFGKASGTKVGKLSIVSRRTMHLASRYTNEALSAPFYYIWHYLWKRITQLTD